MVSRDADDVDSDDVARLEPRGKLLTVVGDTLEAAVGRVVTALAEDRIDVIQDRIEFLVEGRALGVRGAVDRPGVAEVRHLGLDRPVGAGINVPVGGGDDGVVSVDVFRQPFGDVARDCGAAVDREGRPPHRSRFGRRQ